SITQTPDGYIWLGTDYGLLRFDGVRSILWQPPADQQLPSYLIFSLFAARDGTLWIGTGKGLANWKNGKLTQYPELAGHYIFALIEDHEGAIWASEFSSSPDGGRLCTIRKGSVQCYGEDGTFGRGAFNLFEDSKGNLWAGVKTGLWRWRPGPPKFYLLAGQPDGIQALGEDTDGTLLVGWNGGIQRFVDGKIEPYRLPGLALKFRARRMLRDRDGGLWIATSGYGILHVHEGRTDRFSLSDGLTAEHVDTLFEDHEGDIWVITINGLDRFRDFAVPTFSVKQGLLDTIVGSVLADRDGSVWLATFGGLNRWNKGQGEIAATGSARRDGKLNGQNPNSLFQDDSGRVWVSTYPRLGYLENHRFIPLTAVPGGGVLGMAHDRAGNLWVANEHVAFLQLREG